VIDGVCCQKREAPFEQKSRVFWPKTPTYRDKLSDGLANPNRAGFKLDFKLPGQDSNLDKENQNLLCYRYTTGYRELPRLGQPINRMLDSLARNLTERNVKFQGKPAHLFVSRRLWLGHDRNTLTLEVAAFL
jgi:hypothetical protein